MKTTILSCTAMAILLSTGCTGAHKALEYPQAPADSTVYTVNGVTVADTYRPLENDTAEVTLRWVEAENRVTGEYLSKIPFRNAIHDRLTALNNYRKTGTPWRDRDGKYYFYRNDGLSPQSILYRADSPEGDAEVFLDPNKLSDDGTVALTGVYMSRDGKYTAYTVSRSGSDWTEIFVMDTATGQLLDDHIQWAKFTGAVWDGDGFYYSAYPTPEKGKEYSNANEFHSVYYHRLGTPQSQDTLVYHNPEQPLHFYSAGVTDDGKYLIISGGGAGIGNSLYVRDLTRPGSPFVTIEPSQDYTMAVIDALPDGTLLTYTSVDAPMYRVVAIDLRKPGRENWREVIPQADAVLEGVQFAGPDRLIVQYQRDAAADAYVYTPDGKQLQRIQFPTYGTAGFSADKEQPEVFYNFTSFTSPSSVYRYDLATNTSTLLWQSAPEGFDPEDYVTEQVFYPSADGTKIPMFLVYKKGLERNGKNPVYLYGYGGFNISLPPSFSANRLLWLENGGIYAQANLRGGGEYGEDWHAQGTQMNKLNVFNDFIAAAEYMVEQGWTSPEHLVIEGGSNGGLLVGAVTNMRPDLFKVAIPRVGVMDMMRYHLFTIGWNWASDYGTADDSPQMAQYLHAYSPIHNIRTDGTPYPAILVTTADHDDRVVPAHSFKYAATLQAADTGDAPKLIRIDSKAGHGAGKPVGKVIDEYTDIYSFIFHNMGITPKTDK